MSKIYKRRPSPAQYSQTWNNAEFSAVERSQSDGPYLPLTGGTVSGTLTVDGAVFGASFLTTQDFSTYAASGTHDITLAASQTFLVSARGLTDTFCTAVVVVYVNGVSTVTVTPLAVTTMSITAPGTAGVMRITNGTNAQQILVKMLRLN